MEERLLAQFVAQYNGGTIVGRGYLFLPGFAQFGEGDLLVEERDRLVAMEFKHIDRADSGSTARARRTHKRKKVREQALLHAAYAKLRHPHKRVVAHAVTNEGSETVHSDISVEEARMRVVAFLRTVDHGFLPAKAEAALEELFRGKADEH
jgi:Holliday junction resolvase-like predicted endonuclease